MSRESKLLLLKFNRSGFNLNVLRTCICFAFSFGDFVFYRIGTWISSPLCSYSCLLLLRDLTRLTLSQYFHVSSSHKLIRFVHRPLMYKNRIFNSVIHRFLDSANITKTFQQFILHIAFIRRRLEIPIIKIQIKAIITNVTYRLI